MKKLLIVLSVIVLSIAAQAQLGFPSTDSLHRYNNRYIRNSAVEAFSNLRLNTLLHGIISWIDTARAEGGEGGSSTLGIDTLYMLNDSIIRYRKSGVNYDVEFPGVYDASNGLTAFGGVIGFGGTLTQETVVSQGSNAMIFENGNFNHGSGGYLTFTGPYSLFSSTNASFSSSMDDGAGIVSSLSNTTAAGQTFVHSTPDGTAAFENNGSLGITLNHDQGKVFMLNLIDSAQSYQLHYNPTNGKVTYNNASGGTFDPDVNIDSLTLTGVNTELDPIRVDTAYMPTMWKLYYALDSLGAAVSGGLSEVTHDLTMTGTGGPGVSDTLRVDTSVMATLSKLYYIADSLGIIIDTSDFPGIFAGSGISITGSYIDGFTIANTGSPGTNPHNALDIRNYLGASGNAVIPATGLVPSSGTDATPAFNAMMAAAGDGQLCIIPNGNWWFKSAPDTLYSKRVNLLILGNTYHISAGGVRQNFIVIKNNTGAFKQHRIVHMGLMSAVANTPTHRKTPSRISPNWSSYTGTGFTVYNTDQVQIIANKITGFKNGIECKGGGANGAQENKFIVGWLCENANDIALTSEDGNSFVDKNKFYFERAGGGLVIDIDGYAASTYNGAFRSNEFHGLIEFADSAVEAHGDITEPLFNLTIEGGVNTGILGTDPFNCRITSPNYVRNPKWTGQGYYDATRLGTGSSGSMGVNGVIETPIWSSGSTSYYGRRADIMGDGTILIECPVNTSATIRNAAPAYIKFLNQREPETELSISSASYSIATGIRYLYSNNTAAVISLPTASSWPQRKITVFNDHATNNLTMVGVVSGYTAIIPAKSSLTYRSNGSGWYPINDN